jgi:hypothetical protein
MERNENNSNEKTTLATIKALIFVLHLIFCQKNWNSVRCFISHPKRTQQERVRVSMTAKTKGKGCQTSKNSLSAQERGAQK